MSTADLGVRIILQDQASASFGNITSAASGLLSKLFLLNIAFNSAKNGLGEFAAITIVGTGLLALFGGALDESMKAASDLQSALTQVSISVQGTDQNMQSMESTLLNTANASLYSTSQIADGFSQLGNDGFTATDIINNDMGPAMTNFAEALNSQVTPAAQLLGSVMQQFKIPAKDVTSVVNDLTFAFYNGQNSVSGLQQAFRQVAPAAVTLGVPLSDVTIALDLMGQAGIKGTMAGSALRYMLSNLIDPTTKAQKEMEALGITVIHQNVPAFQQLVTGLNDSGKAGQAVTSKFDGTLGALQKMFTEAQKLGTIHTDQTFYQWATSTGVLNSKLYDSKGHFVGLKTVLEDFITALGKMNPEQQATAIQQMFGVRASQAFTTFINKGDNLNTAWNKMMATLNNTSAADDATKRMNTLGGATTQLGTNFTDAMARIGQSNLGPVTQLEQTISGLLAKFTNASPQVHALVGNFLIFGTVLSAIAVIVGTVGVAVILLDTAFWPLIGVIVGVTVGIIALAAVIALVKSHWTQITAAVAPFLHTMQQLGSFLGSVIGPTLRDIGNSIGTYLGPMLKMAGDDIKQNLLPAWNQLMTSLQQIWSALQPVVTVLKGLGAVILVVVGFLGMLGASALVGVISALAHILGSILGASVMVLVGVFKVLIGIIQIIAGIFQITVGVIVAAFTGKWSEIPKIAMQGLMTLWHGVQSILGGLLSIVKGIFAGIFGTIVGAVQGFVVGFISFFQHLFDVLVGHSIIPDLAKAIIKWVLFFVVQVPLHIAQFVLGLLVKFGELELKGIALITSLATKIIGAIVSFVTTTPPKIASMVLQLLGHFGNLEAQGISIVMSFVGKVVSNIQSMPGKLLGIIGGLAGSVTGQMATVGQNMITGLMNALGSLPGKLQDLLKNAAQAGINAFKNVLGIHSPSLIMHQLGNFTSQGLVNGIQSIDVAGSAKKHWDVRQSVSTPQLQRLAGQGNVATTGAGANTNGATYNVNVDGKQMMQFFHNQLTNEFRANGASRIQR